MKRRRRVLMHIIGCTVLLAIASACAPAADRAADPDAVSTEEILISDVKPLVGASNLILARPMDVAVDTTGSVYVLDQRDRRVVVLDRDGRLERTIGRAGQGPGELGPISTDLGIADGRLFVFDLRRKTVDEFAVDGTFVDQRVITAAPIPGFAVSFAADRMAVASGSMEPEGRLATVIPYDDGAQPKPIGTHLAGAGDAEWGAFFGDVAERRVPELMRNAAQVVLSHDGGVWVFMQTERELRRYDAAGDLRQSTPIALAEADAIESAFFDWYADPMSQGGYRFLSVVADGAEIDGRLWLLWATPGGKDGLVTVHNGDGSLRHRIRFAPLTDAEGPVSPHRVAVDPSFRRVYVVSTDSSWLWAFDLPEDMSR